MANGELSSVRKTLQILGVLENNGVRLTVAEIAERLGLPASTTYRYVRELRRMRLLEEVADGSYQLGGRLIELARVARGPVNLIHLARPSLEALATVTGEQVFLSRLAGHAVVCIDQVEAQTPRLVHIAVGLGDPVPLRRGAAAKAILAHLPPHKVLALLERAERADPTLQAPGFREEWLAELAAVRRQGYALAELQPEGVRAVAAALVAPERELAAVTVAGPAYCLTDERLPGVADKVRETVAALVARLINPQVNTAAGARRMDQLTDREAR